MYDFDYWHDYEDMMLKRGAYDPRFDEEEELPLLKMFISIPMRGRTDEEIKEDIKKVGTIIESLGFVPMHAFVEDVDQEKEPDNALWCLGHSLQVMSGCDAVYFCEGWDSSRGCKIEHQAAKDYGLKIVYEE